MRIRRDIPNGYGVEARESFTGSVHRRRQCFGRTHFMRSPAGAVSPGEEWSRPQMGRGLATDRVVSSRFSPELADTQPHLQFGFTSAL